MAQIDASGMLSGFSAFEPDNVDFSPGSSTAYSYTWSSTNLFRITAISYAGNITPALAGTVNAVVITDDLYTPVLSVTGVNTALTSLIDAGNAALNHQKFWDTLLAGETTVYLPSTPVHFDMMGDFARVSTGQNRTGANDTFIGNLPSSTGAGSLSGDAGLVDAGGTLHGGVDRFINTNISDVLAGDVMGGLSAPFDSLGTVYGGDDIFSLTGDRFLPVIAGIIVGDVYRSGSTSVTYGGDDTFIVTDYASISQIAGDNMQVQGLFLGGDDVITTRVTDYPVSPAVATTIAGDATSVIVDGTDPVFTATGGRDRITVENMIASVVVGDFMQVTRANVIGGDDVITLQATLAERLEPPLVVPLNYSVSYVAGDAYTVAGSADNATDFTGGDDVITLKNFFAAGLFGDVYSYAVETGNFTGGDDVITYTSDQKLVAGPDPMIAGDAMSVNLSNGGSTHSISFGDDVVEVDLRGRITSTPMQIVGDVLALGVTAADTVVTFGNDYMRLQGNTVTGIAMIGDASSFSHSISGTMTVNWGDDTLIGARGNDTLYGDSAGFMGAAGITESGGNDLLDGGLGNDSINGGGGIDTASFASVNQAVVVFLDGLPGTNPADPVHAMGQGNDTLIGIENVIGSGKADLIVGDANDNMIEGGMGADQLDGGAGNNTLSYASSKGYVNVSLASGFAGGGVGSHAVGDSFIRFQNILGSANNDILSGDANANRLTGGEGDDILRGRAGADMLDGGEGRDTAEYSDSSAAVNVSLLTGFTGGGAGNHAAGDIFISIENLGGSAFNDTLVGNTGDNVLEGRAGADSLNGNNGNDTASYASSTAGVNVSLLTGFAAGGHAAGDTFTSIENFIGSGFNDTLNGSNGDNVLEGGAGADTLNGNGGSDTASYASSTAGVNVSLLTGYVAGGHAAGDSLVSIENLRGSAFNDTLNGDNGDNVLEGGAGADTLNGNGGIDTVSYASSTSFVNVSLLTGFTAGGEGNHASGDTFSAIENLTGSAFDDILGGDGGANRLTGGAGDDLLRGRLGADTLDGGAGNDTADYADASGAVNVSLATGFTAGSHATGDVFISIENLTGSGFNDTLNGDAGENILTGGAGDDSLRGQGGVDTFVFAANFGNDIIADFADGTEKIDMRGNSQINGIADLTVSSSGADALVTDQFGNSLTILGAAGKISGADFLFF